jgi:hypothetical protein
VVVNNPQPDDATGASVDGATYVESLRRYVENGGNLVVTDGAAPLLSSLQVGIPTDHVHRNFAYVGYVDIQDFSHPFTKGLPPASRQMYDPITLGYQLRIERDGHWSGQPESGTANMAPIWTIDRADWEKIGGKTIATAAPANDPKTTKAEGTATTQVALGTLALGKGRVVFIGALLPDPTDKYPHWFGLGNYGVTFTGHHIFTQAITYSAPGRVPLPSAAVAPAASLPATSGPGAVGPGWPALATLFLLALAAATAAAWAALYRGRA